MSLTKEQEKIVGEIIVAQKANKPAEVKRLTKKLVDVQPSTVRLTITMKPLVWELTEKQVHPDHKPEVFNAQSTIDSMCDYGPFDEVLGDWNLLDDAQYSIKIEDEDGHVEVWEQ